MYFWLEVSRLWERSKVEVQQGCYGNIEEVVKGKIRMEETSLEKVQANGSTSPHNYNCLLNPSKLSEISTY